MPKIQTATRKQPAIGDMRDVVYICTTTERPDANVSTIVERPGVFRCQARIRDLKPEQILDYQAVFGFEDTPSVEITIRSPPDVKIDLRHWVYRLTGYREIWYQVRSIEDLGEVRRFLLLNCSVDTVKDPRSDPATQEMPQAWETPDMD